MQKKWGTPKERMPFPVSRSSHPSSFRAQREIFLAQRPNGERQMRSSRSTHAILSLPHKYRVPLRHKRSLDYARDDDTRERAISHSLSFRYVEGYPCGAVYPPPSARPFFKGLLRWHVKAQRPSATFFPMGKSTKREYRFPRIVISSEARNLPCTPENGTVGWQEAKAPGRA